MGTQCLPGGFQERLGRKPSFCSRFWDASWTILASLLAPFGCLWAPFWRLLAPFGFLWAPLGLSVAPLRTSLLAVAEFRRDLAEILPNWAAIRHRTCCKKRPAFRHWQHSVTGLKWYILSNRFENSSSTSCENA